MDLENLRAYLHFLSAQHGYYVHSLTIGKARLKVSRFLIYQHFGCCNNLVFMLNYIFNSQFFNVSNVALHIVKIRLTLGCYWKAKRIFFELYYWS